MKTLIALLFAATALPGVVQAQDWHGGDRHGGGHGQDHAPAPAQARPAPQPGARPQGFDPGRFNRAPTGIAPFQRPDARPGFDGHRFDRPTQFGGQPQFGGRPAFDGRRFDRGQRFAGQPQPVQARPPVGVDPRRFDHGGPFGAQPFDNRGAFDGQRHDRPGFDRDHQPRPGYAPDPFRSDGYGGRERVVGGGYRPDFRRGGGWNRGWRDDRRFDWNGYRRDHVEAFRLPRYYAPYGWNYGYRRFSVGVLLDGPLFAADYWIDDPYDYRLPPAYGPYRWVRYYGDALLVDVETGEVVDTVYGIFY